MVKSWSPPVGNTEFKKGKRGEADVIVKPGKGVAVRFADKPEKIYKFKKIPKGLTSGKWRISLTSEDDEILGYVPWNAQVLLKVSGFTKGAGEDDNHPVPFEVEKTYGDETKTEKRFMVLLEVVKDKYEGITIPYILPYRFKEEEWQGHKVVGYPSSKGWTKALIEAMEIFGAWEQGPMKYKDNLLPDLQNRILRADKHFNGVIQEGWINTLFPAFDAVEEELDWDEEETLVSEEDADEALDRISEDEDDELPPWEAEE